MLFSTHALEGKPLSATTAGQQLGVDVAGELGALCSPPHHNDETHVLNGRWVCFPHVGGREFLGAEVVDRSEVRAESLLRRNEVAEVKPYDTRGMSL